MTTAALVAACGIGSNDGEGTGDGPSVADMEACESGHSPVVIAVDRDSGDLRWTLCPSSAAIADVLGATDKVSYATVSMPSGEYALVALDAATGKERWRAETAVSWTPGPFAGGDIVAVPFNLQIVDGRLADWEIAGLTRAPGRSAGRFPPTDRFLWRRATTLWW